MVDEAPPQESSVSAPLLVVASNNKGGFVAVITALAMCFVLVAFGIRMYVRMAISGFRLDDLVLAITSVLFFSLSLPLFCYARNLIFCVDSRFADIGKTLYMLGVFLCSVLHRVYTGRQRIW